MKKTLLKLAITAITISALSLTFGITPATADNGAAPATTETNSTKEDVQRAQDILEKVITKDCIDDKDKDKGYIYVIMEEPLSLEEKGKRGESDFYQIVCYRHTFRTTDKKDTYSKLSKTPCNPDLYEEEGEYSCRAVVVVFSKGGTTMIYGYIGMMYRWGVSMVGIIAVLVIVISGIQISLAGGDPENVTKAKARIIQSLSAIAVLILSGIILYTVNPDFFTR